MTSTIATHPARLRAAMDAHGRPYDDWRAGAIGSSGVVNVRSSRTVRSLFVATFVHPIVWNDGFVTATYLRAPHGTIEIADGSMRIETAQGAYLFDLLWDCKTLTVEGVKVPVGICRI